MKSRKEIFNGFFLGPKPTLENRKILDRPSSLLADQFLQFRVCVKVKSRILSGVDVQPPQLQV